MGNTLYAKIHLGAGYDKQTVPRPLPVTVGFRVLINDLYGLDENTMDFNVKHLMTMYWNDKRLKASWDCSASRWSRGPPSCRVLSSPRTRPCARINTGVGVCPTPASQNTSPHAGVPQVVPFCDAQEIALCSRTMYRCGVKSPVHLAGSATDEHDRVEFAVP